MTPGRFETLKRVLQARQPDLTVLAENVHKAHNIAAIIRTCDAVGILEAHAVSETGEMRRHHMVAGGSRRWVPVHFHPDLQAGVSALKASGFEVLAAHVSDKAVDYRSPDYTRPMAILVGSERVGVSPEAAELADGHVMVPMEGMVESLNVSVAAALILYEARRQRQAAGLYDTCRLHPDLVARRLFEWAHPRIAARCRRLGLPYPALTEEGDLAENPFQARRGPPLEG